MEKLLPLLSDSFVSVLESILENNESQIATELLKSHDLITGYNRIVELVAYYPELVKTLNVIKKEIDSLITDEVRALTIRRDTFEISFSPKGKELVYTKNNSWDRYYRQAGKPGRIIKKLMTFDYKEKDIEIFNNLLKAHSLNLGEFKLVSTQDIPFYYFEENYSSLEGTLGNSCMRHHECQPFFDIYMDHAKMLVCLRGNKVLGRALVWEVGGNTLLDRIYSTQDYLVDSFINYAKEHEWWIRKNNTLLSTGDSQYWLTPKDGYKEAICPKIVIQLNKQYEYFPYVDSFRYYDAENNTIQSCMDLNCIALDTTNGSIESYSFECACCGRTFTAIDENCIPDGIYYSEYNSNYYCSECVQYCDGLEDYVSNTEELIDVITPRGLLTYPLNYIENRIIENHQNSILWDSFVYHEDKWYRADCYNFDERTT